LFKIGDLVLLVDIHWVLNCNRRVVTELSLKFTAVLDLDIDFVIVGLAVIAGWVVGLESKSEGVHFGAVRL
jgi:hypothetical protein